ARNRDSPHRHGFRRRKGAKLRERLFTTVEMSHFLIDRIMATIATDRDSIRATSEPFTACEYHAVCEMRRYKATDHRKLLIKITSLFSIPRVNAGSTRHIGS